MKQIRIQGTSGNSAILVGESFTNLRKHLPTDDVILITDSNVAAHHGKHFQDMRVITIGTGEGIKTLDTAARIYEQLLDFNAQRSTFLVGVGGGIVCDITGFVASTFLRGIRFGFAASTLLAQVDASVGGKNGVNFKGFKNMVGVFNQPEFVICDLDLLKTLPLRERLCGFAEIVKHALIEDADMFAFIEQNSRAALDLDPAVIERLVADSVVIKSAIVNRDEKEKGERRKLNFGHTFGHAIEKTTGLPHGESVSLGMVVAGALSEQRALLRREDNDRIHRLFKGLGLPTQTAFEPYQVMGALQKDKKREGDSIHFVLLKGIGNCRIKEIPIRELAAVAEVCRCKPA